MSPLKLAWSTLLRNLRGGQLGVLLGALIVAVAALTSVGFFTDRVAKAVDREANVILAADLRLRATANPGTPYLEQAQAQGLTTAQAVTFPSVVVLDEATQLAAIHAVTANYPLRGELRIAERLFGPESATGNGPPPGQAWADPELLARLGVDTGVTLSVGATTLQVTAVLQYRPDQAIGFVGLAPDLLINIDDLAATDLVQPGSRITWSLLFAGPKQIVDRFATTLKDQLQPGQRLQTIGDSGEQIRSAIDRAQSFLNLAALISVLLAATAVAVSARRYAQTQVDGVALMKCLGASQSYVLRATLWELLLLGLAAGVIGSVLGFLAQAGIVWVVIDLIEGGLPAAGFGPLISGLITALAVLTGFALPSMLALRTVPPLRVLRHDAEPRPVSTTVSYLTAVVVVVALLIWSVGAGRLLLISVIGLGVGAAVLSGAGWLLVWSLGPLRNAGGAAFRYGLANIARRRSESVAQIVAFGFGLAVLLLLSVIRTDLLETWRTNLPTDAPNHFVINVQPNEVAGVGEIFERQGLAPPALAPLVRARITAINGIAAQDISAEGQARQLLRRESNLTWADTLSATNTLSSGQFWEPGTDALEISVEEDAARDMGLALGDQLEFGVAGQTFMATMTSTRQVRWDSFQPNFYFMLTGAALRDAPATFISGIYIPDDRRQVLLDLVRAYPTVSVIDLQSVLAQVRGVMDRAALAVQFVFLFTLLAGIVVLLATIQATREERRYEAAMLRTLGASRSLVFKGVLAEFVGIGALAGVLATLVAMLMGYLLATDVFQLDYRPDAWLWIGGPLLGTMLVGIAGILATYKVVSHPPVAVLRAH
jgi:putative ABC transport system permease protein